ncbi:DUF3108 domain-containing protein [Lacisediminimonas sp.]|uniref:DUF3108 domain-containing protein n=1 Tax=Lacisediminimonas sp. TaxID=3060582 RepID=UPI00271ECF4B|nr:DUF3108 domain-containing protein [Lacisediminimonas sp.]MDO8300524.1 DUF3108 domain-containing protein [Lacisediminimonas sp.]
MPAFLHVRPLARFSVGTLLLLALSILLHLLALHTFATLDAPAGDSSRDAGTKSTASTAEPVIVQLQARATPPSRPPAPKKKPPPGPPRKTTAKTAPATLPTLQAFPTIPTLPTPSAPETAEAIAPAPVVEPDSAQTGVAGNGSAGLAADQATAPTMLDPGPALPDPPALTAALKPEYRTDPPPPAELRYDVQALRQDGAYHGKGKIRFTRQEDGYTITGETSLLFISVLDFRSTGQINERGLEPVMYTEKRFRRPATNTHFQRERELISFSASAKTFPRQGGEQDRASIIWQLAAIGRGDPAQLGAGQEVTLFVAGVRDAEPWIISVIGEETVEADGKQIAAIHLVRLPRPGSYEQRLDIWLAPTMYWYPVKLRFTETNRDTLDMSLADPPLPAPRP